MRLPIHDNAVIHPQARRLRQGRVRQYAHPDDRQIRGKLALPAQDFFHLVPALKTRHADAAVNIDARLAMGAGVKRRHRRRGDPLQDPLHHFQHHDIHAFFVQDRRGLEADVPAADDDSFGAGADVGPDSLHILQVPQIKHAGQVRAGQRKLSHHGTGGQRQFVIRQGFTAIHAQGLFVPVYGVDPRA